MLGDGVPSPPWTSPSPWALIVEQTSKQSLSSSASIDKRGAVYLAGPDNQAYRKAPPKLQPAHIAPPDIGKCIWVSKTEPMPRGYRCPNKGFKTQRERKRERERREVAPPPGPPGPPPPPLGRPASPPPLDRPASPELVVEQEPDIRRGLPSSPTPGSPELVADPVANPEPAPHPEIARLRREVVSLLSSLTVNADTVSIWLKRNAPRHLLITRFRSLRPCYQSS